MSNTLNTFGSTRWEPELRQAAIMDPALSILPDTIQMEWDNVQR